jgi:hypothetical protein
VKKFIQAPDILSGPTVALHWVGSQLGFGDGTIQLIRLPIRIDQQNADNQDSPIKRVLIFKGYAVLGLIRWLGAVLGPGGKPEECF